MDEKEAKTILEKIDNILRDMEGHQISDDYEFFGEITYHDLIVTAKQLISDFDISKDDYYFPCLEKWYEDGEFQEFIPYPDSEYHPETEERGD